MIGDISQCKILERIPRTILIVVLSSVFLAPARAAHPLQQSPSERQGNHLKNLSTEITDGKVYQVKQVTTASDFLYATTQRGLFASMDGGQSWSKVLLPSQTQEVFAVAVKPVDPSHLWAGTREGLWSSQDRGQSWVRISSNLPESVVPLSLSVAGTSELVYMGTARHGFFRSQDSGLTWREISSGLPEGIGASQYGAFSSLALSPTNDALVLVGTELGEIYRTQDAGSTWEPAKGFPEPATRRIYPPVIVFDRLASKIVYAILSRPVHSHLVANTLYKSVDSGASWFAIKELRDNERYLELTVEPSQPRVLFLTSEEGFSRIEDVFLPPESDVADSQRGTPEALDLAKLGSTLLRINRADRALQSTLDQDIGNIAVLVDDGDLIKTFDLDETTIQFSQNSSFDLDGTTIQFTPNTDGGYDVASVGFTFDPTLGNDLNLGDDDFSQQSLGFTFPFYGTNFSEIFVNSNGNLTFGAGSDSGAVSKGRSCSICWLIESVKAMEGSLPRIAGLWDDLDPQAGGAVFFKTDGSSQATITWSDVPEFDQSNRNTFQITLTSSGAITITYNGIELLDGLVGISDCCRASINDSFFIDYSQALPVSGLSALPIYKNYEEGYDIDFIGFTFDPTLGNDLNLGDDDFSQQSLGFTFPFYGTNFSEIFVNSNGNLTFEEGDPSPIESARLFRTSSNSKIAPLWDDFDPISGGGVFFKTNNTDQAVITWSGVPESGASNSNTFQVTLSSDGVITFSYNQVAARDGLVGLSSGPFPGHCNVDYTSELPAIHVKTCRVIYESFADIFPQATAKRFYASHPDNFDQLVVFGASSFTERLWANSLGINIEVKQDTSGIGSSVFDRSSSYGSAGRLQSFVIFNLLSEYLDDPNQDFNQTTAKRSTVDFMGHEVGHRWLARVAFDDGGVCSTDHLGSLRHHWSFYTDSDASFMHGNNWVDNGDGSFTTDEVWERYSSLDQYLMGVRPDSQVTPFFLINDSPMFDPNLGPSLGVTVSGTRQDVTISQVQACEGPRDPAFGDAPTTFNHAFILVVPKGETATEADLEKLERIRIAWESRFNTATGGRASVRTSLDGSVGTTLIANFMNGNTDAFNSRVYLWNPSFGAGDVTVRVFTLPPSSGLAQEFTSTPLNLGTLGARSALNLKLAEDILTPLGIPLPYTENGGDLTLEFTITAANVRGATQVFSSSLAFGTNPLQQIPSTSTASPTVLVANFMNGNDGAFDSRVYLWNPSNGPGNVTARVFSLPLASGEARELTTTPLNLGNLGANSAMNIRLAEDILTPLGIVTPYITDGGNLTVEFTIQAADVRGAAQVFASSFAFGVYPLQQIPSTSAGSPAVLAANFMNGNNDAFNSRVYLWNPSASAGEVTVRVYSLPLGSGVAQELTTEPFSLGILAAESARNIKLAEDILTPLGIATPHTTDGGNLTLEFTIQAADVVGVAQVFSSSFAFGTNPLQGVPSTSAGSPTVLVANFMNGNDDVLNSRVYLWNPSASAGEVTVRVFSLPLKNGSAQELTTTPFSLGNLEARSALNIKLAEDILDQLPGITLPYTTDAGNLTLEFTIQAADVVGAAQVFSHSFAFGTYPMQVMQ